MNLAPLTALFSKLVLMTTVRISRIKLPQVSGTTASFGMPALHRRTGIIYIPDTESGSILRVESENEKLLEPLQTDFGIVQIHICQERDIAFMVDSRNRKIVAFRIDNFESRVTFETPYTPYEVAFDGERDILMILGGEKGSEGPDSVFFYRYPDFNKLSRLDVQGTPVRAGYDEIEDTFMILCRNPGSIVYIDPSRGLDKPVSQSLGDEDGTAFDVCLPNRILVAGTASGEILSLNYKDTGIKAVTKFKEPVSAVLFNSVMNHLYVSFSGSRNLAVIDLETMKTREVFRCSSVVSNLIFDELHNKIYAVLPETSTLEIYLDQGR